MSVNNTARSVTGVGSTEQILINSHDELRAMMVVEVTGIATYNVEYSLDGVFFIPFKGSLGLTTSDDVSLVFPVYSVRARITSGTGSVKITVRQTDGKFGA